MPESRKQRMRVQLRAHAVGDPEHLPRGSKSASPAPSNGSSGGSSCTRKPCAGKPVPEMRLLALPLRMQKTGSAPLLSENQPALAVKTISGNPAAPRSASLDALPSTAAASRATLRRRLVGDPRDVPFHPGIDDILHAEKIRRAHQERNPCAHKRNVTRQASRSKHVEDPKSK